MEEKINLKLQLQYEAEIREEIFIDILEKYIYLCRKNMEKKMQEYNVYKAFDLQIKH